MRNWTIGRIFSMPCGDLFIVRALDSGFSPLVGALKRLLRTSPRIPIGLLLMVTVAIVAGCGGGDGSAATLDEEISGGYVSPVLDTSYAGALSASNQLALGTLLLEDTDVAVTPEQAEALLPLWQALRGGVTAQAEVNAVLKQIEGEMTPEQLEIIVAMRLTRESMTAWAEENGMSMPTLGGDEAHPASQDGRPSIRATLEAEGELPEGLGGGTGFGGGMSGMSDEERENLRATVEAGGNLPFGGSAGERPGGSSERGTFFLIQPLVALLTERAGS